MDDRWTTSTDPDELLALAGPLTRDEASAIVTDAYRRVEHLVTVEEMEAAPAYPHGRWRDGVEVSGCLAWAREVEHEKLSDLWLLETTGGYGAPAGHDGLDYVLEAIDLGARLGQVAMIRRIVTR